MKMTCGADERDDDGGGRGGALYKDSDQHADHESTHRVVEHARREQTAGRSTCTAVAPSFGVTH